MATIKKTTSNLSWLLLACSVVLVLPKLFFSQTENITVELTTTNSHNCDVAEFFGGVNSSTKLPNYIRFAQQKYRPGGVKPTQLASAAVLGKPFDVLRIDPCTRSNETIEITGLKLSTKETTRSFSPPELEFECTNCELKRSENQTIIVTVHGADSQLVLKNLDSALTSKTSDLLQLYQKLRLAAYLGFGMGLTFLLLTLTTKSRALLISLVLGNVAAVASFYLLYKKRFSLGFNLPFGNDVFESGIANMHLTKYSRYTDVVIYGVPLCISLVVVAGILWWSKRKK